MNIFFRLLFWKKSSAQLVCKVKETKNQVFMALAYNGHRRDIILPNNFDIEAHLAQYPPNQYGFINSKLRFTEDKIYYFLSLLSTIPARNKDLIDEEGWVPINMKYIRNNIKDIKLYRDYLVNTHVLECNNHYIPQVKSLCYRWSKNYIHSEFQIHHVRCSHEEDAYFIQEEAEEKPVPPYLHHWYNDKKLAIDPIVWQYAKAICKYKMADKSTWDKNSNTNQQKNPHIQYMAALVNLSKIKNNRYEVHIDNTVHRLHSVITNLQKDYRNFLTYNKQELASIDIKNSQPYLACALLNPDFWHVNNKLSLSLYSLSEDIQKPITTVAIPLKVENFFHNCTDEDFKQYKEVVANGILYETMVEICQNSLQQSISRKEAKTLMFYLLFSSNQGQHDNIIINQMKNIFSTKQFPKVAELFKLIKHKYKNVVNKKQHNRLACLLQSIESEIILHRCCKRIWEEGKHQIPVFTIHDSIVTTIKHVEYVKIVMQEELFKAIGVQPTLNIEHWNLNEVEHKKMLQHI